MSKTVVYYLLLLLFPLLYGCSGDGTDPTVEPDPEPVWDKSRTVKVAFLSDLTGNNPFTVNSYPSVASFAKDDESHLLILDKANVRHAVPRMNPGAKIAVAAERVPLFVSIASSSDSYIGSMLLFKKPVQQMELISVHNDSRMIQNRVEIRPGLSMNVATASFIQAEQVTAAATLLKSSVEQSVLVTGTIRREHLPQLRAALSASMQESSYELTVAENSNSNSTYCIYILGSKKWKYRNTTESTVQGTIKSVLLEVEYLK